ncbi:MAG TPA: SAM-dependent methyltransferase [Burkholderiaceae bacterium]|nr:SAM-dependent methyltransferase [Burkholderiaceae bacterium]
MSASRRSTGSLVLVPNTLDFGASHPQDLTSALPLAVIQRAASIAHWVVEDAKTARAFIKRVSAHAALAAPLQSLDIRELPRGTKGATAIESTDARWSALLRPAHDGHDVGLLSEAGLPAVADPGGALVAQAHAHGISVEPLPGANSLMLALAASGLNGQHFAFVGYLPIKDDARAARIRELDQGSKRQAQTQIAIETPYRNAALLRALLQHLSPATRLCVACAIGWPEGWCRMQPVSQWRRAPPQLSDKLPTVFLFQAD